MILVLFKKFEGTNHSSAGKNKTERSVRVDLQRTCDMNVRKGFIIASQGDFTVVISRQHNLMQLDSEIGTLKRGVAA